MNILTKTPSQTQRFAQQIVKRVLASPHGTHAAVVALSGDLGAGKTTFAQGFARALGVKQRITSPTFIIFRRYALRAQRFAIFYHVDAYRLSSPKDLLALGFKKILADPKNIVLIEWADNVRKLLLKDALWIHLAHGKNVSERAIAVHGRS